MPSHYDYDLIRDYLHGLVDAKAARDIGELIETDETARGIAQGILYLERTFQNEEEVENYLRNFRERQQSLISGHRVAPRYSLWIKIAASVALIVTATTLVINLSAPDPIAMVSEELAHPYPVSGIVRGEAVRTAFQLGLEHYAAGKYDEAISYFRAVDATNSSDPATLNFYYGLSCLYSGDFQNAITLLESEVVNQSRYAQQARWHAALAMAGNGSIDEAKKILTEIANNEGHYKSQEANTLLDAF